MTVVTRNKEAKEAYAAVQGKEPEGYSWEYALDLIGDAGEQITVGDEIETILTGHLLTDGWKCAKKSAIRFTVCMVHFCF